MNTNIKSLLNKICNCGTFDIKEENGKYVLDSKSVYGLKFVNKQDLNHLEYNNISELLKDWLAAMKDFVFTKEEIEYAKENIVKEIVIVNYDNGESFDVELLNYKGDLAVDFVNSGIETFKKAEEIALNYCKEYDIKNYKIEKKSSFDNEYELLNF